MSEEKIDLYEVVKKLTGPITPVGCSRTDEIRLENLKNLTNLIDSLLNDIHSVESCKHSYEGSVKAAGEHCSKFLDELGIPNER